MTPPAVEETNTSSALRNSRSVR
ncbi:uncharacterized protein METZ01_LOCUS215360, partial [marine metagenome]